MGLAFAEAAQRALPRGGLAGLAVGNEPDLYRLQPSLEAERLASTTKSTPKHWTRTYNADAVRRATFSTLRVARSRRHLRGVPLAGPELTHPECRVADEARSTLGSRRPDESVLPPLRDGDLQRASSAAPYRMPRRFLRTGSPAGLARTLTGDLQVRRRRIRSQSASAR